HLPELVGGGCGRGFLCPHADRVTARQAALRPDRHRDELLGTPIRGVVACLFAVSDLLRHGRLGWVILPSRRVVGWTRNHEAVLLARTALEAPDGAVIVEVGSFLGCSTVLLAGARKLRGHGRVHAVDTFRNTGDAYSRPIYSAITRMTPVLSRF